MAPPGSRPLQDPYPRPTSPHLRVIQGGLQDGPSSMEDGALKIEHPDGSVTINFNPQAPEDADVNSKKFDANLAKSLDDDALCSMATDLLEGIQRDEQSRREWLETRARGIELLGLKLERPRSNAGDSSAPLEGMSVVRHPLLLDATVSFQATARGELLPASGPVKVRNDTPPQPMVPPQQTNAQQQLAESLEALDELGQALEKDMNHYLTAIATEYVPDTDRMLFYIGFGGDGFKKVYNCPLRQRPVSESVDPEDLIVSNAATDLNNCGRVTHKIKMRKSVLKRMQILGAYRDIDLSPPQVSSPTVVDQKKEEIDGRKSVDQRPEDRDYEIYECYCELDIDQFAPPKFKGKGLPLPYRVTLEKESQKILDIRRNWKEDDRQCRARPFFVQFPFIRGLGFYGLGFIHLLGNTANALTGAWRLMLDNGMFSNFPGFLFAKGAGRQNTNQFRVAPGSGVPIDVGAQQSIKDMVMPLPYKEASPSFAAFIQHVEEVGQKLASTANMNVGEGKQDAPVGTTLALIEQATKVLDSAHKRLHAAQAEEFKLLKERFREDPEAFWRHNRKPAIQWQKDQFIEALSHHELVPVADPNNPTSLHRIAKAMAIKELQKGNPNLYDPVAVDMRIMRIVDIDPQGLFRAQPAQPPPDPRLIAIQQKAKAEEAKAQLAQLELQLKSAQNQSTAQNQAEDRASRERIEQLKIAIETLRLEQEKIIHAHDINRENTSAHHELIRDHLSHQQEMAHNAMERQQDLAHSAMEAQHEAHGGVVKTAIELETERRKHEDQSRRDEENHRRKVAREEEEHQMKMQHEREMHQARLEAAKQMARAKPKKEKAGGKKE